MPLSGDFRSAFLTSANPVGVSIVFLLGWLALCDDSIDDEERSALREIASAGKGGIDSELFLSIASRANIDDLQLCLEVMGSMPLSSRETFLQLSIGVAIADGYLRPSENHVLRFLADALEVPAARFRALFLEVAGKPLPPCKDLSDANTWVGENTSGRESEDVRHRERAGPKNRRNDTTAADRVRAHAILGLEDGATAEEIRLAYKRLAKVHHPDRFAALGPEAERAATATFQRIKSAYDTLGAP